MIRSLGRAIVVTSVATLVVALYTTRLSYSPAFLMHDEVNFALQAYSIATTGRDTNGRLLPVYFSEQGFEAGRDPVMIYATAAALLVWPLSEAAVRWPTAMIGALSVLLLWAVGRRVYRDETSAMLAAAFLTLTPAHFVNARLALSIAYQIPFVLGWLLCMLALDRCPRRGPALGAGLCLGCGMYSYLAAVVLMPAYLAASVWLLADRRERRLARWLLLGFLVGALPLLAWLWLHPERLLHLADSYRLAERWSGASTGMSVRGLLDGLRRAIDVTWAFFDPSLWFIGGFARATNSTGYAGMFPLAFAVLVPVGLVQSWRGGSMGGRLVVLGCAVAPIASAISLQLEINRVLVVLPFGALAAAAGAHALLTSSRARRWVGIVLVLAVPVQFVGFYLDYMGPYRVRSSAWFGGNQRAAVLAALDSVSRHGSAVFLPRRTPIERYWRFYAIVAGRPDLAERPIYYVEDSFDAGSIRQPAVIVSFPGDEASRSAEKNGWRLVGTIRELDGQASFLVYERS